MTLLDRLSVAVYTLAAGIAALFAVLFVPTYVGTRPFPVAVVIAVGTNILIPRAVRAATGSTRAATLPVALWLLVVIVFGTLTRPEGDVILPGGTLSWVTYGVLLGGAIAGALTLVVQRPAGASGSRRPPLNR